MMYFASMKPDVLRLNCIMKRAIGSNWNSIEGWANGNPDPSRPQDRDPKLNDIFQATAAYYLKLKDTSLTADQRHPWSDHHPW